MSDQSQAIRDDIAFMKAMAQEGRTVPLTGGSILLAGGLIFGLASLTVWAVWARVLALPLEWINWFYFAAGIVFMVMLPALIRRAKRKPGSTALVNRANAAGWLGLGCSVFAMGLALGAATWRLHSIVPILLFPSGIMTFYGAGWTVAATMSGRPWMRCVAGGSWVTAVTTGLLVGRPEEYLLYGAALFLLAALPGLVMMRGEPSEIV